MKKLLVDLYEGFRLLSRPSHWSLAGRDCRTLRPSNRPDQEHIKAALAWLCRAQDAVPGGVSAGYFCKRGWMPAYPETTGYIIPTLLQAGYVDRALALGEWEIEVQLPSGAVRGGIGRNDYPIVFNTGQVILGWMALYRATAKEQFLAAATCAADWLVEVQDPDGKWSRHTYLDAPRAYHARVAWPLLEVYAATDQARYQRAAIDFLHWIQAQRLPTGGFAHMALEPGQPPITHTIAYTLRGLLECGLLLDPDWRQTLGDIVAQNAFRLIQAQAAQLRAPPSRLPAALDDNWSTCATHSCLPGNAQLAIVLLKIHAQSNSDDLARAALALIEQVKACQVFASGNPDLLGGLPASLPIWGSYVPFALPNWGAKFLLDALQLKAATPGLPSLQKS